MNVNDEIVEYCVKPGTYKGWKSVFCGAGSLVFEKQSKKISAYRGIGVDGWMKETWLECKEKIDQIESAG
ncbi:hypothetical protein [Cohnella sp. GCM10027633]|uniref:hypothetical protein n=1 Tax=unclassified Cohnella TaxID=2636738 RepID=UPI0036310300